ncbi:T9SS type A sorting domain-containing protein [candidate division WOR-3 bacterium]|nr:T9SS type A sorting domain-containing protein [candidate division WOR-3 bacterium]
MKKVFFVMTVVAVFSFVVTNITAQTNSRFTEFPIAVGEDSTFGSSAVWGGATGIVAIIGDTLSQYNITAQLVSPPTNLIGNRISVGRQGTFPGPIVGFDETNYFLIWREFNGDINGQFISTSGNLVGTYFTIGTNAWMNYPGIYGLCFSDTTYLIVYVNRVDSLLYGQRMNKSGNLLGEQVQISNNHAREISLAYDGTNYLVAWVEVIPDRDKDIYGQFVSKSGSLVGSNFLIDGGPYYSDNPTSLAFDSSRYLLGYHESNYSSENFSLYGRFITTLGLIEETILICDSTMQPGFPSVAFDNNNYLITWSQMFDLTMMGRFWTPSGIPLGEVFVVSNSSSGKAPFGGCGFGGGWFLVVTSKVDSNFTDGDVYGTFISSTGIEEKPDAKLDIKDPILLQNTPNPFKSATSIQYTLPRNGFVRLAIYDISGQLVRTLVKGEKYAGTYAVSWNGINEQGNSVRSGIYFYCLDVDNLKSTRKMLLVK